VKNFEWRFPRSTKLPCASVRCYDPARYENEANWVSDDELDIGLAEDLRERYCSGDLV
jgi:hypothetical protein